MHTIVRSLVVILAVVGMPLAAQPAGADEVLARTWAVYDVTRAPDSGTLWTTARLQENGDAFDVLFSHDDAWSRRAMGWAGPLWSLTDVTMTAADDGWALLHSTTHLDGYVGHWNGSTWTNATPAAFADRSVGHLTASTSDNVWVTADYYEDGVHHDLINRWDGTAWHAMPVPDDWLSEMITLGPENTWLKGSEHTWRWDGSTWRQVADPPGSLFYAVASGDEIWASAGGGFIHWDGRQWSVRYGPDGLSYFVSGGMDVTENGDVWFATNKTHLKYVPRIVYYSAGTWTFVDPPIALCGSGARLVLNDVDARTNSDVVVAGECVHRNGTSSRADDDHYTFVAHYDGHTWTRV